MGKGQANITARTRFTVPRISNATVERTALIERLDAAADCGLTLVAAAPGSGKTALLMQWANSLETPVAWLSCDVDDADPSWFWSDVIAAIRNAWPDSSLGDVGLTDDLDMRQLAIEIANELSSNERSGVIIIDDFHLAAPEPTAMVAFIDSLPSSVRLVLGTRHDPLFPLGRMRVQGRLLELRQADLRLTDDEIERLLATLGVGLEQSDLDELAHVTEGWPAGVHLAGLSLKASPNSDTMLTRLVESDRSLVDFLMNEVIELQTPDLQDFLLVTGELESFDIALCDSVTGRTDSVDMLDSARSANLFLVALDSGVYRYHHLFGGFLRARLRRVHPTRIPAIHRAAARAFTERDDLVSAIRHRLRAGDIDDALAQLTLHMTRSTSLADQTIGGTVAQAWLELEGASQIRDAPQHVLSCVIALDAAHKNDAATSWLQRVEANESDLDAVGHFMLEGTRSFHLLYQGDPAGALEHATRAKKVLDEHDVDSVWAPSLPLMFLQAQLWLGDAQGAAATIEAQRHSRHQNTVTSSVRMPGYASQVEVLRGDFVAASRLADQAHEAARLIALPVDAFGIAEPVATMAEVAIEQGRLADAEAHVEHLMRIVDSGRRPLLELKGHLLMARVAAARRDDVVVDVHLDRARRTLPTASQPLVARIDHDELLYALSRGEVARARLVQAHLPPSPETELAAARILLHADEHAAASTLLKQLPELATPRLQIEQCVLAAMATAPSDLEAAHRKLHDTLRLAREMGYQQTIIDEGPVLWVLLRSLPVAGDMAGYVDRLLTAAEGVVSPTRPTNQGELIERLSERELTVLRYLSSRLDGTEIAAALYLSVNTVRSHVKAIYRKLGVNSRAEAVHRARTLGLI